MQKIRLPKLTIIGLAILVVTSVIAVYAYASQDDWVLVDTKSATVKAGELSVVTFDMPPGRLEDEKFDFRISEGTIMYWAVWSTAFDSDLSEFQLYLEDMNAVGDTDIVKGMVKTGNESHTFGYDGLNHSDQKWDIFLLNEDSYDKDVQIIISKR